MTAWNVTLHKTCFELKAIPACTLPEIAIAGRSNVGKSTLLNALFGRSLARVSKSPGKTRSLNFYRIQTDSPFFLVDLPGYGYAKRGFGERSQWGTMIEQYFLQRRDQALLLQLVDFRHGLLANDRQLQNWVRENRLPCQVVFTKADKIARGRRKGLFESYLSGGIQSLTKPPITGAAKGLGIDELRSLLEEFATENTPAHQ
ncbi:MAG: ribosome biogenesis GTP-binding protein YihA/YsxC [Synergistales bacterium]|nr:ribosome biogenesis GTP-binding protein YihA/YsxC [Synergistales bacterium]